MCIRTPHTRFHNQDPSLNLVPTATSQNAQCSQSQNHTTHSRMSYLAAVALATILQVPALSTNLWAGESTIAQPNAQLQSKRNMIPLKELPQPVLEMRDAILSAVQTGNIEDLRTALDWNELPPDLGLDQEKDPIEHWKKTSPSRHGYEILAILANILVTPPAHLPIGRDLENNDVFIWPFFSETDPKELKPAEHVLLHRIASADVINNYLRTGNWTGYRLAIGADGTWHTFTRSDKNNKDDRK